MAAAARAAPQQAHVQPEEAELWTALADGCGEGAAEARERLFAHYLPFARKIASRRFHERRGPDLEFGDLYQLACAGLLEAIDGFDPGRGVPFRGYAARRIAGSVLDGITRTSEVREQMSCRARVRRERVSSLMAAQGRGGAPAGEALHALADLAVGLALGFLLEGTGLVAPENESDRRPGPYQELQMKRTVGRLREGLALLPDRERGILRHHYDEGLTFEHIGELLGITKGRVSQLHRSALSLLRKRLQAGGDFRLER